MLYDCVLGIHNPTIELVDQEIILLEYHDILVHYLNIMILNWILHCMQVIDCVEAHICNILKTIFNLD